MGRSQEDVRHLSFWRAVVSEFLGTAFLVAVGCGARSDTDHREHAWTVKVNFSDTLQHYSSLMWFYKF